MCWDGGRVFGGSFSVYVLCLWFVFIGRHRGRDFVSVAFGDVLFVFFWLVYLVLILCAGKREGFCFQWVLVFVSVIC